MSKQDNMTMDLFCQSPIQIQDNISVRKIAHKGEWFFSVVDTVEYLTGSVDGGAYWRKLKQRLIAEGSEVVTKCHGLKLLAPDGKLRKTDCANIEGILRIIQSIPSPKAEPYKRWLSGVGAERIKEEIDPSLAVNRAVESFKKRGKSKRWISERLDGILARNSHTDVLVNKANLTGQEVGVVTAIMHKGLTGMTPSEHKEELGVKDTARNHMNYYELSVLKIMEYANAERVEEAEAKGLDEVKELLPPIVEMGIDTKKVIEKAIGRSIRYDEPQIKSLTNK